MNNLDLDIQNYNLEDILKLFHLNYNFNEVDLKGAYRISLKTHPDKSGLDPDIFRFFQKAYKVLSKIFYFRNKKTNTAHNGTYTPEPISQNKAELLRSLDGKNVKDFNKWFNEMFEKTRTRDENVDNGYGEWYNNYHDKEQKSLTLSDFGREFEKEKRNCKAIVVQRDIEEMSGGGGYSLNRDAPVEYSSDVFSKLKYEDLKKAHTQTVVPVTREDFEKQQKFKNVDEYRRHRAAQMNSPISLQQSREYIRRREEHGRVSDTHRIYSIIRRDEEIADNNKKWWGHLQRLNNK
jgi:curved DNA-binding protein CbpA